MNYRELCKEDLSKLECIWKRCYSMLEDEHVKNNYVMSNKQPDDIAHCLWLLDRGFSWNIEVCNNKHIAHGHFRLQFDSIEELEMNLAMRGY